MGYALRMQGFRVGAVSYLNARPLVAGLPGVTFDVPSHLTEAFRRREVDVALLPVFEVVRDRDLLVVPGISVSSYGPVESVLFFSRRPLRECRKVLLDESSLSSAALARILFSRLPGPAREFRPCAAEVDPRAVDADAVLLIGDRAMTAPREGLLVHDLAVLWREWTGLPFCFALWVARDRETVRNAAPVLAGASKRVVLKGRRPWPSVEVPSGKTRSRRSARNNRMAWSGFPLNWPVRLMNFDAPGNW